MRNEILIVCLAAVLMVAGCSRGKQPTYPAGGVVRYPDGEPLKSGRVSFRSVDDVRHITASGEIQPDGSFTLTTFSPGDGAVEGRHQVVVSAPVYRNQRQGDTGLPPAPLIDTRFSIYETSGLEFKVSTVPEENQFQIEVTRPKSPGR